MPEPPPAEGGEAVLAPPAAAPKAGASPKLSNEGDACETEGGVATGACPLEAAGATGVPKPPSAKELTVDAAAGEGRDGSRRKRRKGSDK